MDFGELPVGALGTAVGFGRKEIAARRTVQMMFGELFDLGVLKEPVVVFRATKMAMKVSRCVSEACLAIMYVVTSFEAIGEDCCRCRRGMFPI